MSIIENNSVLILGAGTSVQFGMPLGGSFIDLISRRLKYEIKLFEKKNRYLSNLGNNLDRGIEDINYTKDFRTILSMIYDQKRNGKADFSERINEFKSLTDKLDNQTSDTIDSFIAENTNLSRVCKIALCSELFSRKSRSQNLSFHFKTFDQRYFDKKIRTDNRTKLISERNWSHHLINLIRFGIRNGEVNENNPVNIITFNYDTVLEQILETQFANTFVEYPDWNSVINLIHVHGKVGNITKTITNPLDEICDWADGIYVVGEDVASDEIKSARHEAKDLIKSADNIYAVGFSFSKPNCDLIGLSALQPPNKNKKSTKNIIYCNFDGNLGLSKGVLQFENVERFESKGGSNFGSIQSWETGIKVIEHAGSPSTPLTVSDWFKAGYAGQLPS